MSPRMALSGAQSLLIQYQFTVISWFALMVVALLFYHLLSDGDFSFLLTLGAVVRLFAFITLLVKMVLDKSADGLSGKTLIIYLFAFMARLTSILRFEGYLPYDSSGDWLYQAIEVAAMLSVAAAVFLYHSFANERNVRHDVFFGGSILPGQLSVLFLIIPAMLLALLFHPNLNGHFIADYSWTVACYVETFALVPQLVLFQRTSESVVSAYISNWAFALGVARLLHFFFWWKSHHELNDRESDYTFVGWMVIFMQFLQILMMIDFIYHFLKSAYKKQPMVIPSNLSNV